VDVIKGWKRSEPQVTRRDHFRSPEIGIVPQDCILEGLPNHLFSRCSCGTPGNSSICREVADNHSISRLSRKGLPADIKIFPGKSALRHSAADAKTSPDSRFSFQKSGRHRIFFGRQELSGRHEDALHTSALKLHEAPASRLRIFKRLSGPANVLFDPGPHLLARSGTFYQAIIRYEWVEGKKDLISKRHVL
jgi:hypothetical protein